MDPIQVYTERKISPPRWDLNPGHPVQRGVWVAYLTTEIFLCYQLSVLSRLTNIVLLSCTVSEDPKDLEQVVTDPWLPGWSMSDVRGRSVILR